jgi:flagellar M-ring protein FliF
MDYLRYAIKYLGEIIRNMTASQMVLVVSLAASVLIACLLLLGVFRSVTYVTLYSDLDSRSVSDVIDKLDEMSIPHRMTDGGKTVKVPSGDVYKARIRLASAGLPESGTVGYSIFDETSLGMTEFLQKMNFRRALEGELARSIMELSGVQAARVHVVIPEDHLFEEDKKVPTASVLVKLRSGSALTSGQIRGVTHLVAASVEGLTPDNISIIDYHGNLLTSNTTSDPLATLSSTQLELRKNVERYLEDKAQTLLDQSLGDGRSIVRVTAQLDFDQLEKTTETYDPDNLSVRSEERIEETSEDASVSAIDSSSTQNKSTVANTITNYEVNRTVERVVNSVGNIDKLTVAVLVDGNYQTVAGAEGVETLQYTPREADELERITALVKNAVGFDDKRSDKIEVVSMQFDTRSMEKDQDRLDEIATRSFYMDIGKKVLLVIAGLLIFLYGKRKIKKIAKAIKNYVPPLPSPPQSAQQAEAPAVMQPQKSRLVDQMKKTAEERPDEIARVIRTIMTE